MTANIQISKKLNDGTILVVGGDTAEEFNDLATSLVGAVEASELAALFFNLIPASAPAGVPASPVASSGFIQAEQTVHRAFPQAETVQQPDAAPSAVYCPTHKVPAKRMEKKDGSGHFWKCETNGTIISEYGKPGDVLKKYCPKPKD